jgi:uncharacterized protein YjiS (DUF1127 family)
LQHARRRARIESSLALWAMAAGLVALLRNGAAVQRYRTWSSRRHQRMFINKLRGMDDHLLRDISVRRCEIVSLVASGDNDEIRLPRSASRRAA